jgi:hypothetical protein
MTSCSPLGLWYAVSYLPKYPPTTSIAHLQERFGATLSYLDETLVDPERPPA